MCDNYVVDVYGASFGVCKCGVAKNEHKIVGSRSADTSTKLPKERTQLWQGVSSNTSPTFTDATDDNSGDTDSQGRSSPTPSVDVSEVRESISEEVFQQYKDLDISKSRTKSSPAEDTIDEHSVVPVSNMIFSPKQGMCSNQRAKLVLLKKKSDR